MLPRLISAFALLGVLAAMAASAGFSASAASAAATTVVATWTRVSADGITHASSLTVSSSDLIARTKSSDGSVIIDSGPLADIDMLAATICAHPKVMMMTVGMKSKSFHEVGGPRIPANFYEDIFFLQFGDVQTEKRVARAFAILTGVSVEYDTDCTSSE